MSVMGHIYRPRVRLLHLPLIPACVFFLVTLAWSVGDPGATVSASDVLPRQLTSEILDQSLAVGRDYLLNSQRSEGNFIYEYDFVARKVVDSDNGVRQAGALWAVALLHSTEPSDRTRDAAARGLAFFGQHARESHSGEPFPIYPGQTRGQTNVPALLVLALVDTLRADDLDDTLRRRLDEQLDQYLGFLLSLRRDDGFFHRYYDGTTGRGIGTPSPYADGEALLAMARAARFAGREDLKDRIIESARRMYNRYVVFALDRDSDSAITKGFYQWGSMAFFEINEAGWDDKDLFARRTIKMAHWMIDVHSVLTRRKNTAYAFEGLAVACELARRVGDNKSWMEFALVVDKGLCKLTSWQVGGPIPNWFLVDCKTDDPKAVGGVMNGAAAPVLRIDVAQHQMHALILARRLVYGQ